ncbi:MAG: hypothetical protein GQ574_25460 [Crocinitomix sp.]|nr:hypothetical protein [Crocinitomix sp.]
MISFLKYLGLISILLWCIPTQLCAQGLNFENYSTHNGLPSAQVYHMYQDPFGDIWFATDRGIAKYDGFTFESFEQKDGLTSNTVFKFYPQKDSTVWCSTVNNSLFYFHPESQVFEAYKFNDTLQKHARNYLMDDVYLDPHNNLYLSFENICGHLIIDKEGHVESQSFQNRRSGDLLSAVFNVDIEGEVFTYYKTSSMKKVPKYDISYIVSSKTFNNGYKKCELVNNKLLFSVGSNLTISDHNGNCTEIDFEKDIIGLGGYDANHFWLGFKTGGLKIFNMQGIEIDHYLSNKMVSFVLVDSHNGIWVSTLSNGVFFAHSDKIRKFNFKHNSIFSLSAGLNQNLLVSTIEGNAYIFNEKKFQPIKISDSEAGNRIYFKKQDSSYFGHLNKRNVFGEDLNSSGIIDFSENDLKPSLFCSPWSAFIWRDSAYHEHQMLQRISQVEWAEDGIFFGTYNALYFFDTLTLAIEKLNHPELQFRTTDIKMSKSYHYIGTSGNGLIKYNERTGDVQKITTREGLSSDIVNEVFPENDSTVWVATTAGLNYVVSRDNKAYIRQIKIEDGLPDNDITDVYVQNNQVWIATRSGLCLLDKNTFEFSKPTLNVYLFWEDVYCNEMLLNQVDQNQLSHKQNNMRMTFHTAYFGGNKNIKFRYKLVVFPPPK